MITEKEFYDYAEEHDLIVFTEEELVTQMTENFKNWESEDNKISYNYLTEQLEEIKEEINTALYDFKIDLGIELGEEK